MWAARTLRAAAKQSSKTVVQAIASTGKNASAYVTAMTKHGRGEVVVHDIAFCGRVDNAVPVVYHTIGTGEKQPTQFNVTSSVGARIWAGQAKPERRIALVARVVVPAIVVENEGPKNRKKDRLGNKQTVTSFLTLKLPGSEEPVKFKVVRTGTQETITPVDESEP